MTNRNSDVGSQAHTQDDNAAGNSKINVMFHRALNGLVIFPRYFACLVFSVRSGLITFKTLEMCSGFFYYVITMKAVCNVRVVF